MRYAEDYYTSTDGLRLFFRDYGPEDGRAAPVLCLPGLTRNSRDFDDLARRLAHGRRVVCPDLRGRGNSDWDRDYRNYHPSIYLGDVTGLLEAIGLGGVLVIGTSLGGVLAMIMAATRPDLVRGVVLNDAGPEVDPKGLARISQYAGRDEPASSWEEAANACRENYGDVIPGLSDAQWAHFARQSFREDNGAIRLDMDPRIGDAMRELNTTPASIWPVYEMLRDTPTLVIRGENSDILSQTTLEKMAEMKPDLQQAIIPDRGHAPLLNEPASLAAIDAFLSVF